jgi:O-succinylbenzoate synthase
MVQIERITLREVRLPLKEPFRISSGVVTERRITVVELLDADGAFGWGEGVAGELPNYSPETIDTMWLAIREWLAPRVLGKSFTHPERLRDVFDEDIRGHNMAKASLEMAAWEMMARKEGIPLSKLLGGTQKRVPVGISLGIQKDPEALVERARAAHKQGYRKIKIKIKPGSDIEFVGAVRAALGSDADLMVDANNAYTLADADHLAKLDDFGLTMIEQPLEREDFVRHAELQKRLRTPICMDESITSTTRAEDMITLKSGRIINIKPGRVGGFATSKEIHDVAARAGIPVWCGGMLESGIGRAHNVSLASLPNFVLPGDLSPSARYWERDIVTPEWTMDPDGMVNVPVDKVGMGVEVDMDRVENLLVRSETFSAR